MHELAHQIARSILNGFERHFSVYQEISTGARERFEKADWIAARDASAKRINFYDTRVDETIAKLRQTIRTDGVDEYLWQDVKAAYVQLLETHLRPELAETFYNSVFCRLFERKYYNNDKIFIESVADREELVKRFQAYISFYPRDSGLTTAVREMLNTFYFAIPYEDLERDARLVAEAFGKSIGGGKLALHEMRIDLLETPFYRNKAAYLIGRVISGTHSITPFVIPLMNNEQGGIYVDTLLTRQEHVEAVFSFARTYFMAKTPVPAAVVDFLKTLMPDKPIAELYMSIGFHKQAKNEFYREFLSHLANSDDAFIITAGTPGMVMSVFTLPSFPYVFKVIRDHFPPQKNVTRDQVKKRYLQVKQHDRVGRMADTLEFADVAFPRERFSTELMAELCAAAPSLLSLEDDTVVIRHLYIERRMTPLDLFLEQANDPEARAALAEWSDAIIQLMTVNIFPGDLLFKNFGVSCQGKVVFYDYDEICYLTECNFRRIPPPRFPEDEMAAEPWYAIGPNDIFPEEFATFITGDPQLRKILLTEHPELFDYRYWQGHQANVETGVIPDIFPYPDTLRFANNLPRMLAHAAGE